MLLPPTIRTPDLSAETLERYRSALPDREWQALSAWATTLYPSQRAWVFEPSRRAICCATRQGGKSHGTAGAGVLWGAFNGELTTIISKGEVESIEVLDKVAKHATILTRLGSRMAKMVGKSATQIRFASGGRVFAAPSTGGRGFTGNLFLDELAYQEHAEQTWDAALPITMRGGFRVRIASTPNGIGNLFHGLWAEPTQHVGYALHEIPLLTAIDEGLDVDLLHCWAMAKGDRRLFDQFFNCRFLDGDQQYLPTASIAEARADNLYVAPGVGAYFAGLDIGREHDLTALVVVNYDGKLARVRSIRTMKRTDHAGLHGLVDEMFATYPITRLSVDATGLGTFPTEEMQRRHGAQRVEAVTFGSASKELLATTLHSAFTGGWVRIPNTDATLRDATPDSAEGLVSDLCSLRRIILPGGGIRYDAPRGPNGHADRAWALALALYGITTAPAARRVSFD